MGDAPKTTRALQSNSKQEKPKNRHPLSDFISHELDLETDQDAKDYLEGRGITMETAKAWHLGLKLEGDKKWLMIPYIVDDQWIVDVKYRTLPPAPKAFKRMGGGDSVLFGEHTLEGIAPNDRKVLYLCEGEIDAMTLWQQGYRPVVSTTTGAGSFKPRWHDVISAYNPDILYIIYDSDVAGQEGAKARMKQFDNRVVKNVVLPTNDVNSFFFPSAEDQIDGAVPHTNADLDALLASSEEDEIEHVVHVSTALNMLEMELFMTEGGFSGVPSQFPEVNELIGGGYWNGFMVTISGIGGIGKTSFALQELFHASAIHNMPAYMLCLEMPVTMMMRKLLLHRFHLPLLKQTVSDVQTSRPQLDSIPIYLGDGIRTIEDLEKTIRAAKKRYDLRIMAFDNINYFVRSKEHQTQEIGIVSKLLKDLAVELDMTMLCVAQPTKFDNSERVMTQNDIKDASSIAQDSDVIMLLSRKRNASTAKEFGKSAGHLGNYHPHALLRVEKARYAPGGETVLYLHADVSTYRSLTASEKAQLAGAAA